MLELALLITLTCVCFGELACLFDMSFCCNCTGLLIIWLAIHGWLDVFKINRFRLDCIWIPKNTHSFGLDWTMPAPLCQRCNQVGFYFVCFDCICCVKSLPWFVVVLFAQICLWPPKITFHSCISLLVQWWPSPVAFVLVIIPCSLDSLSDLISWSWLV